ncbi:MAG: type IX secretion system membrane protein PorP/SprF [Cytophagales bacterium]|nr:type IX secretion system membrane protein PorP/SprF [Cytophagales bacterium]
MIFNICQQINGQSPFFVQLQNTPLQISPSLAACDNDFKVILQYRHIYRIGVPNFLNYAATAVMPLTSKKLELHRWGGVGMTISSQDHSSPEMIISLKNTQVAYAHNLLLANNLHAQAGFLVSYNFYSISNSNFNTGSQYNDLQGFNPNLPNNEKIYGRSDTYLDFAIGVSINKDRTYKDLHYFVAAGLYHPLSPKTTFLGGYNKVYPKVNVHAGYRLKAHHQWHFQPELFVSYSQDLFIIVPGGRAEYHIPSGKDETKSDDFYLNFIARWWPLRAVIAGFELRYHKWKAGIAYDIYTGPVQEVFLASGAYEVTLGYYQALGMRRKHKDHTKSDMLHSEDPSKVTDKKSKSKTTNRKWKKTEKFIKPNTP